MTSADKARAWRDAAALLDDALTEWRDNLRPTEEKSAPYIHAVVIPSLKRRAAIIRRNARKGKR